MKRTFSCSCMFVLVVFLLCTPGRLSVIGNAHAQEKPSPALPTPEMQRLAKLYVGTWDYTEAYPKPGANGEGPQNKGVYTSELGPGGNSLVNHFHSRGPVGDFEGMLVMTWDAKEKAYKAFAFGSDFPGVIVETGQWEGETLVFRGEISMGTMKVAVRNATRLTTQGKLVSDEFSNANGAPEKLLVHVEATKRP